MVKMMIFLRRRTDLDRASFAQWWLDRHRPLAERLPGLRRYVFNLLPDGGPYDAVVEQWFESDEAAAFAYAGVEGRDVAADSLAHVSDRLRLRVEEHAFTPRSDLDSKGPVPASK